MLRILADHAGLEMAGQKFDSKRIKRRTDGRNLVQDIDAIPIVFDHPLDPSDLAGDSIGPAADAFPGILEHEHTYTQYMYIASERSSSQSVQRLPPRPLSGESPSWKIAQLGALSLNPWFRFGRQADKSKRDTLWLDSCNSCLPQVVIQTGHCEPNFG
jgi:hypothetical protein